MYETRGTVTSVSPFSETDDQITIQTVVPEPLSEEGDIRENDLIVPKGSAKVGDEITIVIKAG